MPDLRELYRRKREFPQYRREQMMNVKDAAPNERLKELKAKRARLVAEIDAEIAQLKYEQAIHGGALSLTERKAKRTRELSEEKRQLDEDFAQQVKLAKNSGRTIAEIAQDCGAESMSIFYQAMNYKTGETIELNIQGGRFVPTDEQWEYSDVTSVHRYAVNARRTVFRVHDPADHINVVYIRRADSEVIGGDSALANKFDSKRANLLLELLDNESINMADYKQRPNPYEGIENE